MLVPALFLIGALALSGCGGGGLLVSAATTGGVAAVQERSVGDAVDDLTIRAELNQLFFEDNVDLLQSVSFNVIEGRVLLKGSVKKQEHRVQALELAWQAGGGVIYNVSKHIAVDLGYRFFSIGDNTENIQNFGVPGEYITNYSASELLLTVRIYEPFRRWR